MKCPECQFDNPSDSKFCKDCGTQIIPSSEEISVPYTKTLQLPMKELEIGSVFAGRYQTLEELGKGGMGRVYKALDKEINEEVAIKLLKPEIASDESTIERFRNELKFARKISHKNVCRMYHIAKEGETPYITMEYVPGEDLKSLVKKKGKIPEEEAVSIARQVCEGLAEAHELGVVHRDLKPQNIMIDSKDNVRIMDFGIARSLEAKGVTATGMIIGTPDYISPEQAEGEEADHRSDIYSLGVILYEMVTGKVPFKGDTALSVALKHKTQIPQDPRKLNPEISEDLSRLILICMEKDKKRRYQKAEELLSDLINIEDGLPLGTKIRPRRETFAAALIRKKLFIPALAIAALLILALVIWQPWSQREAFPIPSDKPSLAVMYFENNTGDEGLDHWRKMLSDLLITDLTQSKHLRILSGDRLYKILNELNQVEAKTYSTDVLNEVATQGRVEHLLLGKYAKMGDTFRIDVVLQEVKTGEAISSLRVEARGEEEVFPKVDELTRRIKASFNLSAEEIEADIDKEVGKITTSSSEAYKFYSKGMQYFARGDYRQVIQSLQKAVAIDPEFAMAYRNMAQAYVNLGNRSEQLKYWKKALEFIDRISLRERYLIQVYGKKADEQIETYNKLLEIYPDDWTANLMLGNWNFTYEQWDKAKERYKKGIQIAPETVIPYTNLALVYMVQGLYDEAKKVIEYYINNFSDNYFSRRILATNYFCQGKYDRALAEMDKAFLLDPTSYFNTWIKGDIELCRENFRKAEKEYQKLLEVKDELVQIWGRDRMGCLYLSEGKFEESENQIKQGIELAKKIRDNRWRLYLNLQLVYVHLKSGKLEQALTECDRIGGFRNFGKALTYIEMKSMDEAQRETDKVKSRFQKGKNEKLMRYYHHLIGKIELEKENFSQAIENFQNALALYRSQYIEYPLPNYLRDDHALFMEPLARAYYLSGNIKKAREEYEKIISLSVGRIYYGDIYAKSFYMLGEIYDKKGKKRKAIENYDKFLDLWKDADPGIAEVEDARERLAALRK